MKKAIAEELAFNFRAHGHLGRVDRTRLSLAQAQMVARTAARTPEVMVKVLGGGATTAKAVRKHLEYIGRKGEVDLLTDYGLAIGDREGSAELPLNWDLDMEEAGAESLLERGTKAVAPRLVHKLVFSMPPGTNSEKVYGAVQNFCREEFGLQHRYVMALHTDDAHPHVHVVLKAMSEQGKRLNIKKVNLKEWRVKFAHHLRELGVAANATPRQFRTQPIRPITLSAYWQQGGSLGKKLPPKHSAEAIRNREEAIKAR